MGRIANVTTIYIPTKYVGKAPKLFKRYIEQYRKMFGLLVWTIKVEWCDKARFSEVTGDEREYSGYTNFVDNGYRFSTIYILNSSAKQDYEEIAYHELRHIWYFENVQGLFINRILPKLKGKSFRETITDQLQENIETLIVTDWEIYEATRRKN